MSERAWGFDSLLGHQSREVDMGITGGPRGMYIWLSEEELERLVNQTDERSELYKKLKRKLDWIRHLDR